MNLIKYVEKIKNDRQSKKAKTKLFSLNHYHAFHLNQKEDNLKLKIKNFFGK